MADADEALWQHMEEEAAQELRSVERHDALLSAVSIILPSEGDPFTIEAEQAMVGNGDAMGVAAEIAQHMFGTAEGRLGIDELMSTNEEVSESIRPLLRLCREHIDRSISMDTALLRSLERDPLLADRLRRLRTVPGVGPITALTWALEMGDTSRFHNIKQAISYCGLCSGEKSSAGKVMRTPISKQRNKHIQQVLVEAARLAPRYSDELALLYERERQRGNGNRATLAVARKMVALMLAVERRNTRLRACRRVQTNRSSVKTLPKKGKNIRIYRCAGCQVPQITAWATEATPEALFGLFRDWQRTQTQSSVRTLRSLRPQMDVRFCSEQEPQAERQTCADADLDQTNNALSRARKENSCFSVDKDLHGWRSSDWN